MVSKTEKKIARQGAFLSDLVAKLGSPKRAKAIKEKARQDMKKISKRGNHHQNG